MNTEGGIEGKTEVTGAAACTGAEKDAAEADAWANAKEQAAKQGFSCGGGCIPNTDKCTLTATEWEGGPGDKNGNGPGKDGDVFPVYRKWTEYVTKTTVSPTGEVKRDKVPQTKEGNFCMFTIKKVTWTCACGRP